MTRRGLPFRHFGWLLIAALLASPTRGAEPASATGVVRDSVLRMTEFFDTTLPGVLGPHNLALDFRPKFSDLRDSEYMRLPFELRYGLAPRWELRGGLTPFFPNPINSGTNHRWGPGELKLSARHDVGRFLGFFDETTLGAEVRLPLGHPPAELNDHYTHLRPFVALARQLRTWPHTTFYTNLAYDRSVDVTHRDPPPAEISRRNLIEFAPGLLFKPAKSAGSASTASAISGMTRGGISPMKSKPAPSGTCRLPNRKTGACPASGSSNSVTRRGWKRAAITTMAFRPGLTGAPISAKS
ncbi:MAG: hypothetical protein WCQ89_06770 [Verrucomicrobiota bacterium]